MSAKATPHPLPQSSVQGNGYYASYEVEPMLELLWTEDGAHQDTRYKVFLPVVTPSWLQSVYVTDCGWPRCS